MLIIYEETSVCACHRMLNFVIIITLLFCPQLVRFEILDFSTQDCTDKLDVHDGDSTGAAKIATAGYCGNYPSTVIHSYGDRLFLNFVTDSSTEMNGFLFNITFLSMLYLT